MSQFDAKSCIMLTQTLWRMTMRTMRQRRPTGIGVCSAPVYCCVIQNPDNDHKLRPVIGDYNQPQHLIIWSFDCLEHLSSAIAVIQRNKQAISCSREASGRNFNGYQRFYFDSHSIRDFHRPRSSWYEPSLPVRRRKIKYWSLGVFIWVEFYSLKSQFVIKWQMLTCSRECCFCCWDLQLVIVLTALPQSQS